MFAITLAHSAASAAARPLVGAFTFSSGSSSSLAAAFGPTGYLNFVKVLEVVGGLLVAIPRTRRMGLLVLGPILVLYVAIAQPFYATWWLLAGLALSVGGFALLVLRSPNKGDHEDDDSGARV